MTYIILFGLEQELQDIMMAVNMLPTDMVSAGVTMCCRMLQLAHRKSHININCADPLGRDALSLAIDGENLEMVELLVIMGVETKDALLHSIDVGFVEAAELLLEHEELIHKEGEPYVSPLCEKYITEKFSLLKIYVIKYIFRVVKYQEEPAQLSRYSNGLWAGD
jgi:hypothetical protein